MPWNGSGTYNLDPSYYPEVNGTVIDAVRYNGLLADVKSGLNNVLTKNGENSATANIPMGGFVITGLGTPSADGHSLAWGKTAKLGQTSAVATSVGASQIDCSLGNYFYKTVTGPLTWTFVNAPSMGQVYGFVLELANGGLGTQTWPASVKWAYGSAPVLRSAATDILVFLTRDGGTTWRANLSIPNTTT